MSVEICVSVDIQSEGKLLIALIARLHNLAYTHTPKAEDGRTARRARCTMAEQR